MSATLSIGGFVVGEEVVLTNGDTLNVVVKEVTAKGVVAEHALLGELVIPLENIESPKFTSGSIIAQEMSKKLTETKEKDSAEEVAKKKKLAEEAAKADKDALLDELGVGEVEEKQWYEYLLLPGWKKSVQLGFSGSEGNSETTNINGGFKAKIDTDTYMWDFDSAFFYGKTDGEETKNQAYAQLKRDFKLVDSKWFLFTQARYDYDTFQDWRHRIAPNAGIGYQIFDEETFKLKAQAGPGFAYNFGDVEDKFVPELSFGWQGSWNVNESNTITGSTQVFPNLDEYEEYRATSSLDWKITMDQLTGLSLKFGLLHEYNSMAEGDTSKSDVKYYGSLVYDF
ncbi:DUF481 domain-containing protein [Planctomycetota bacterium]|nr:DUF481 domain-containing protein [Planctomycetota bacterium]